MDFTLDEASMRLRDEIAEFAREGVAEGLHSFHFN